MSRHRQKLTDCQAYFIRDMRGRVTIDTLAAFFGVSRGLIFGVQNCQSYLKLVITDDDWREYFRLCRQFNVSAMPSDPSRPLATLSRWLHNKPRHRGRKHNQQE
jgi:hypothetical protein